MIKEFRSFILRGNVVSLAVVVVIGGAFGSLVKGLVTDLLTPLISIPGTVNFENLKATIHGSTFHYGDFLNLLIAFVLIAFAVFFFVVRPLESLTEHLKARRGETEPETKDCPECITTIPYRATRCPNCTSHLEAPAAA